MRSSLTRTAAGVPLQVRKKQRAKGRREKRGGKEGRKKEKTEARERACERATEQEKSSGVEERVGDWRLQKPHSGFSARVPPLRSNRVEERRTGGPEKGGSGWARVSSRTSASEKDPLLRPHYIVYLSSEPPHPFPAALALFLFLPFLRDRLRRAAALFPCKPDYAPAPRVRRVTVNQPQRAVAKGTAGSRSIEKSPAILDECLLNLRD